VASAQVSDAQESAAQALRALAAARLRGATASSSAAAAAEAPRLAVIESATYRVLCDAYRLRDQLAEATQAATQAAQVTVAPVGVIWSEAALLSTAAAAHGQLAELAIASKDVSAATIACQAEAQKIALLLDREPNHPEWGLLYLSSLRHRIEVALQLERMEEAQELFAQHFKSVTRPALRLAAYQRCQESGIEAGLLWTQWLQKNQQSAEAVNNARDQAPAAQALVTAEPTNPTWVRLAARAELAAAEAYLEQGQADAALPLAIKGAARWRHLTQDYPGHLPWSRARVLAEALVAKIRAKASA
jgi:hypothetical protein